MQMPRYNNLLRCCCCRHGVERLRPAEAVAIRRFSDIWLSWHENYKQSLRRVLHQFNNAGSLQRDVYPFPDGLKMTWVVHCGGSQGYEAATILQAMHDMVDLRTIIRGYQMCEHTDTLSQMPVYFRDTLDESVSRTFSKPYNASHPLPVETSGSGEITLYARDYREIGRWIPEDSNYIIGRYMFEVDRLPAPWVQHCNALSEVWVPSEWQKRVFVESGVEESKIQVQ
jgi:hypothetical protein